MSTSPKKSTSETSALRGSTDTETLDLSAGAFLAQRIKGRENKQLKAARLLVTGRLRVLGVERYRIWATCRGDSGEIYKVDYGVSRVGRWTCSCVARTDCSHLAALWAVTAVER